jgi:hypothetical protein
VIHHPDSERRERSRRDDWAQIRGGGFRSRPCTMIWDTSTRSRKPCNLSTTRSARGCHPCLRYVPLPMSSGRTAAEWRRGRDSNPRYSLRPYDALAKRCLQPLGHLSGASLMHLITWAGQFGSVCFCSNIPSEFRNQAVCSRAENVTPR